MKTVEDLIKSRESRVRIIADLGEIPESILRHNKTIKAIDPVADKRSYFSCGNTGGHTGKLGTIFDISRQGVRSGGPDQYGALSRFSQNVGRILLLLYSDEQDTVIDPFAGHNSRMELCWRNNRNYIGHDVSADFMAANREVAALLAKEQAEDLFNPIVSRATIQLIEGDSRRLPIASGTGDFTITSPPYWDLEFYGNEPAQLSGCGSYSQFLDSLQLIAIENYRVLKPGAFCVWCVNDFRKDGRFYSYHENTAAILRVAGFVQHDIAIIDLGSSLRAAFATQIVETKILPKRHEYCLIFKK